MLVAVVVAVFTTAGAVDTEEPELSSIFIERGAAAIELPPAWLFAREVLSEIKRHCALTNGIHVNAACRTAPSLGKSAHQDAQEWKKSSGRSRDRPESQFQASFTVLSRIIVALA